MILWFKNLKKHLFIYWVLFKDSLILQMEYRTNFFMMIGIETAYLFVKVLYVVIVYDTGVKIYDLPIDAILLFSGTFIFMTGIYSTFFFFNLSKIQNLIVDGSFDMLIVKPVSLQFITTLKNINICAGFPNLFGGIICIIIGWKKNDIPVDFYNIAGYVGFLISGIIVSYSVMLLPQLISFWTIQAKSVRQISDSLWEFNNMPMTIYGKWIQRLGIYMIPIFLISNLSPLYVLKKLSLSYAIWGMIAPIVFFIISRILWKISVKHYNSASS